MYSLENKIVDLENKRNSSSLSLKIAAVGDIMAHMPQVTSARQLSSNNNDFDFHPHFKPISNHIKRADIAFCNLETTFGGKERGYSGYPLFNAPSSLGKALKNTGFNVVSTANNHSMDTGKEGLLRTLSILNDLNLTPVGTYESENSRDNPPIIEENGIDVGFTAYTYGTNGIPTPEGKNYLVNRIDKTLIEKDIKNLKNRDADIIIVSLHWGLEYSRTPSLQQKELANEVFKMGADIILGHHPHVLQPAEINKVIKSDGTKRKGLVVYSLGNFISNQRQRYRDSGVILVIDLIYDKEKDSLALNTLRPIPTWVDKYYEDQVLKYNIVDVYEKMNQDEFRSKDKKERLSQIIPETKEKIPYKPDKIYLRK